MDYLVLGALGIVRPGFDMHQSKMKKEICNLKNRVGVLPTKSWDRLLTPPLNKNVDDDLRN